MRKRANAVIDAWFSPNSQPVETLYRRFGVIHFVVDKKARANPQLSYFEPFKQSIAQSCRQLGGDKRWIMRRRRTVSFAVVPLVEAPLASSRSDVLCDAAALVFNQTLTEFATPLAR